ncbi:ATP-binding protein [Cellulomonas algicola]|uniref:ATP-binding protein n=1 Tax=Cellulomonas algicola TaxID=2071633 RepID=UPI001C3F7F92|nr:ATP-binding protein [Cellulomonas algicola]
MSDDEIVADLVDSGAAFAIDLAATMPGADAESGRGLALAEAVLDVVELRRVGAANHWHLVRRLRHADPH